MLTVALGISFVLFSAAILLNMRRLLLGPTPVDRVLALDTTAVNAVGLIVLLGIQLRSSLAFEAAIFIAMVGFVSTVLFCRYLTRGDIIE